MAPRTGPTDRRRVLAAALSAVVPGLGQAYNGRRSLAVRLAVPALAVAAVAAIALLAMRPAELLATVIVPSTLAALLALDLLLLGWRLFAVGHAFLDRRFGRPVGRGAVVGLALILAIVALPHLAAGYYGYLAYGAFGRIFDPTSGGADASGGAPSPPAGQRINVLLMGVDAAPGRDHALADTLIVASLDPVGRTLSMVSVPRDMVDVPLGDGRTYGPKINSLMSYAAAHPAEFPRGPVRTVEDAIGALLGIPVHYYAEVQLGGFVRVVDAVGGIDVTVKNALDDPNYGGYGFGPPGRIPAGRQHMDGPEALAYARIRKSSGESDFTRAARQQEILVAIRDAAVRRGLLLSLPGLLDALSATIETDLPPSMLPQLAAIAEDIGGPQTTQVVIRSPLVHAGAPGNPYGDVQVPVLAKIRAMAAALFPPPGSPPMPWPTPRPTATPRPSPARSAAQTP